SEAGHRRHQPRRAGHPARRREDRPEAHCGEHGGGKVNPDQSLQLPSLDYSALAPMLILFGVACVGVLVEGFVPRAYRHRVQLPLALLGLVAAFVMVLRQSGKHLVTAASAIAVDGPALFLSASIIALGIVALLLVGERALEPGGGFVAQAAVTANTDADRT